MTARERLRAVAARLEAQALQPPYLGGELQDEAAALRALADRWDNELAQIEGLRDSCSEIERGVLARLDAPVTPGEPGATCGTCKGTRTRYVSIGAFGEVVADQPCQACTPSPPRSPEAKACEAWCGGRYEDMPFRSSALVPPGAPERGYCSMACRDAGKALNPRAAK